MPHSTSHLELTPPRVEPILQWGKLGTAPGEFHSPIGMALTPRDELWVTDVNNSRLQKFTSDGRYLSGFHLPRDTVERNQSVCGSIAVGRDGLLYVAFMGQHCIRVFSESGDWVREWGQRGAKPGDFNQPGGLIFDREENLLVADQCNHRIQVFTPQGKLLRVLGRYGKGLGEFGGPEPAGSRFGGPHLLGLDRKGNIYTTEGTHCRVQQLAPDGVGIAAWGDSSDGPGGFGARSSRAAGLKGPIGVVVDKVGRVWVSSLNDRIQVFTPMGKHLLTVGGATGDKPGQFARPHSMVVDSKGFLYVADAGNQRIQKFRLD